MSGSYPDKVADQISDAVLDAILAQDRCSRVAAETLCNTGLVVLAGEITSHAVVDYQAVARETIREIGYDDTELAAEAGAAAASPPRYVLTLSCPDTKGIVAAVSGFLAANHALITEVQQFDDPYPYTSFVRTVFA